MKFANVRNLWGVIKAAKCVSPVEECCCQEQTADLDLQAPLYGNETERKVDYRHISQFIRNAELEYPWVWRLTAGCGSSGAAVS